MTEMKTSPSETSIRRISGLSEIAANYDLLLCDVWGVLHNGVRAEPGTIAALTLFRKAGGTVILITNAPRQRKSVFSQLQGLGVPEGAFDTIATSGDVTRELMRKASPKQFHIGPDKDLNLFEGLDIERVGESEADVILCSGLWDDRTETPQDYLALLGRLKDRNLPFICANPDIFVDFDGRKLYCAGALAREYERLGGKTLIAGKPHRPIYDLAVVEAEAIAGRKFAPERILAIGDGIQTDIKGAADFGVDSIYVSAGIHAAEYGDTDNPNPDRLAAFMAKNAVAPVAWLSRLAW